MRLPDRVLRSVRGSLLAATVAGCSAPAASTASPANAAPPRGAPPATAVAATDPVRYDATAEAERLTRLDRARAAADHRRDRRIEDEGRARHRHGAGSAPSAWDGSPDVIVLESLCGRG